MCGSGVVCVWGVFLSRCFKVVFFKVREREREKKK